MADEVTASSFGAAPVRDALPTWELGADGKPRLSIPARKLPAAPSVAPGTPAMSRHEAAAFLAEPAGPALDAVSGTTAADITAAGAAQRRGTPVVGIGESIGRAALSMLPGGSFSDEIEGAIKLATEGTPYSVARDIARLKQKQAFEAHPLASIGGGALGLVGGGAALAPWRGIQTLRGGAALGAVEGLGASEADLTRGEIGRALLDTGAGGLGGAAGSSLFGRVARGAPARVDVRRLSDILTGEGGDVGAAARRQIVKRAGAEGAQLGALLREVPAVDKILSTSGSDVKKLRAATQHVDASMPRIEAIYERTDAATGGGIRALDLNIELDKLSRSLAKDGRVPAARAVRDLQTTFREEVLNSAAGTIDEATRVPMRSVKNLNNDIGDAIARAAKMSPAQKGKAAAYGTLNDLIRRTVASVEPTMAAEIDTLNRQVSTMLAIKTGLEQKIKNAAGGGQGFGAAVRTIASAARGQVPGGLATMAAGMAGGVGAAIPVGLAAPVISRAAKAGVRRADYRLAKLVEAAAAGDQTAVRALGAGHGAAALGGSLGTAAATRAATAAPMSRDEAAAFLAEP